MTAAAASTHCSHRAAAMPHEGRRRTSAVSGEQRVRFVALLLRQRHLSQERLVTRVGFEIPQ